VTALFPNPSANLGPHRLFRQQFQKWPLGTAMVTFTWLVCQQWNG